MRKRSARGDIRTNTSTRRTAINQKYTVTYLAFIGSAKALSIGFQNLVLKKIKKNRKRSTEYTSYSQFVQESTSKD